MGAAIVSEKGNGRAPLSIAGRPLHGITYRGEVASAQVKSALILAGLQATGVTRVWEPVKSRDHSERLLPAFGVHLGVSGQEVEVAGGQELSACEVDIPGDLSSAAFLLAAALLVPGSYLRVRGVGINPTRTGIVEVFRAMGGEIDIEAETETSGEPVGDLVVRSSVLHGTTVEGLQVVRMIDEVPILAVAAACARGTTIIRGAQELRVKESDRLHALAVELGKLGVAVQELPDGLVIEGRTRLRGGRVQSYGDHRIAMALAVAGLVAEGGVVIEGAECANISFLGFYDCLQGLVGHGEKRVSHCY
jgi:3-phosphoshikimate 1-carboxyvinyltransferase